MESLEQLASLGKHVHNTLRVLKVGDTGTITCGKAYPAGEVKQYVIAYAFHKRKWFELKHDRTADLFYAKRVEPPSFLPPSDPDEFEEK